MNFQIYQGFLFNLILLNTNNLFFLFSFLFFTNCYFSYDILVSYSVVSSPFNEFDATLKLFDSYFKQLFTKI
jgi:hypothetical protein